MQAPSQMLVRLNMETRADHPEADAPWLDLLAQQPTSSRYLDLLIATYGFEAPIEASLALTPHLAEIVQLRQRSRTGAIVQDLLALGMSPSKIARLPQCAQIVPFRDTAEAFGWLYVAERTTLLHENIHRVLVVRMPHVSAWSYLSAYGGHAGLRWQELGQVLDLVATTPAIGDAILAGARAAFACHREWYAADAAAVVGA